MPVYELSSAGSVKTGRTLYTSMNANNSYGAMVPIQSATVTGSPGNILFSNIPQIYQDLFVALSITTTSGESAQQTVVLVNTDYTTSNYSVTILSGDGSSATSSRSTTSSGLYTQIGTRPAHATNLTASHTVHFLNYTNTTTKKTILSRSASDANGSGQTNLYAGLYQGTSAITSLLFGGSASVFAVGSTATLYGIRAVSS